MPYTNGDGTYHDSRRCRRLHNTGRRIRRVEAGDRDPCGHCAEAPRGESETDSDDADICTVELSTGDGICGRNLPCPYHSD